MFELKIQFLSKSQNELKIDFFALSHISVLGHRAEEIATSLNLDHFKEKDDTDIVDLLNATLKVSNPENYSPKPLYVGTGNSSFKRYERPKVFD